MIVCLSVYLSVCLSVCLSLFLSLFACLSLSLPLHFIFTIPFHSLSGCTPLILAANAGHAMTVSILLEHNADIEAQTDRTKDTALSLACSSGRQEVIWSISLRMYLNSSSNV